MRRFLFFHTPYTAAAFQRRFPQKRDDPAVNSGFTKARILQDRLLPVGDSRRQEPASPSENLVERK